MIIVSDTSPICYLLLIDQIDILQELYRVVIIPQVVADELNNYPTAPHTSTDSHIKQAIVSLTRTKAILAQSYNIGIIIYTASYNKEIAIIKASKRCLPRS
ncbi:hypothetical protein NUACC26_043190 [Scytonema sp. NUACC26]